MIILRSLEAAEISELDSNPGKNSGTRNFLETQGVFSIAHSQKNFRASNFRKRTRLLSNR
jgi:hypothetical protein